MVLEQAGNSGFKQFVTCPSERGVEGGLRQWLDILASTGVMSQRDSAVISGMMGSMRQQ